VLLKPLETSPHLSIYVNHWARRWAAAFIGRGGEIDGVANPVLSASPGQTVQITLINGDGVEHDLILPGLEVDSDPVNGASSQTSVVFDVHQEGKYVYYSSASGRRETGMEGWLVVGRGSGVPELASATGSKPGANIACPVVTRLSRQGRANLEPVEAASIVRSWRPAFVAR
jgi:nitrite reductase (NO-forming)